VARTGTWLVIPAIDDCNRKWGSISTGIAGLGEPGGQQLRGAGGGGIAGGVLLQAGEVGRGRSR